jgi:hypothetical protein
MTAHVDYAHRMRRFGAQLPRVIVCRKGLMLGVVAVLVLAGTLLATAPMTPLVAAPAVPPTSAPGAADSTTLEHRVIAYYFHTNYRCASCRQIEAYSHAAIEAAFPAELASGRLVWRLVNVDEKENEHFVEDYGLFTKSLVVVEEAEGQQVRWKNLAKVWELLPSKEKFYDYVQSEVRGYLTETP